jgi:hypothetical protein
MNIKKFLSFKSSLNQSEINTLFNNNYLIVIKILTHEILLKKELIIHLIYNKESKIKKIKYYKLIKILIDEFRENETYKNTDEFDDNIINTNSSSTFGGTIPTSGSNQLLLSTRHITPNRNQIEKTEEFIYHYSQPNFNIRYEYDAIKYFMEFKTRTGVDEQNPKLIISIKDPMNELLHISFFKFSYIHITFFYRGKKYRLYVNLTPDIRNNMDEIRIIIERYIDFFLNIDRLGEGFFDNNPDNNWRDEVFRNSNKAFILNEFSLSLLVFLEGYNILRTRHEITSKFISNR